MAPSIAFGLKYYDTAPTPPFLVAAPRRAAAPLAAPARFAIVGN
jgi:hypothetical protein